MAKDKSKKNAYVDVICTEFVTNAGGYKEVKAEYPRRFPAEIWERIRVNNYANKEFRLAPANPDEVKPIDTKKVLSELEEARAEIARLKAGNEPKQPKEFIPKSHKEILLMNKAELIEYCVAKYNTDPKLYEGMKNKELQAEAEKQ